MGKRSDDLQIGHELLQRWADFELRYEQINGIGYPQSSVEGRLVRDGGVIRSEGKPCSKIPRGVFMPRTVAAVCRAVSHMPSHWKCAVFVEYKGVQRTEKDRRETYAAWSGRSKRDYRESLTKARASVQMLADLLRDSEHRE